MRSVTINLSWVPILFDDVTICDEARFCFWTKSMQNWFYISSAHWLHQLVPLAKKNMCLTIPFPTLLFACPVGPSPRVMGQGGARAESSLLHPMLEMYCPSADAGCRRDRRFALGQQTAFWMGCSSLFPLRRSSNLSWVEHSALQHCWKRSGPRIQIFREKQQLWKELGDAWWRHKPC